MALPEEEPARFEPESFLPLLPEPLDLIDGVADCIRLRPGRRLTDCLGLGLCVQAQRRLETNKKGTALLDPECSGAAGNVLRCRGTQASCDTTIAHH